MLALGIAKELHWDAETAQRHEKLEAIIRHTGVFHQHGGIDLLRFERRSVFEPVPARFAIRWPAEPQVVMFNVTSVVVLEVTPIDVETAVRRGSRREAIRRMAQSKIHEPTRAAKAGNRDVGLV